MILKQSTFQDEPVYIPFADLGKQYAKVDMDKPFKRTLRCGREFEIRRSDYRDAPCPMATDIISDKAMDKIATALEREFNTYIDAQTDDESFDDALCREEENLLCELGVPYFEDEKPESYKKGDRVFYMDGKQGCYATIEAKRSNSYEMHIVTDAGEKFIVHDYEIIKEF